MEKIFQTILIEFKNYLIKNFIKYLIVFIYYYF